MEKIVEISNLSYTYPDGTIALKGVNLEVNDGESVGIIGPNGAGKSTLLLHFNGVLLGQDGEVKIFGMPVKKENLPKVRKAVGLLFQDPDDQLFMPTVFDDVAFGPLNLGVGAEEVKKRVEKALLEVGLPGTEKRFSHHLSLGEKKKISLATVLAMDSRIILFDEPTSNLDPKARRQAIEIIRSLAMTKIIATHDLDLVRGICSRVVLLYSGGVVAQGETREILGDEKLLEKYGLK